MFDGFLRKTLVAEMQMLDPADTRIHITDGTIQWSLF